MTPLDQAYRERNEAAAALAAVSFGDAWVGEDPAEPGWLVLYLESDDGQVSWHIGPQDFDLIEQFPRGGGEWDGHSQADRSERLKRMAQP